MSTLLEEDTDGYYLYTVDYDMMNGQAFLFYHPPETWKSVLTHLPDEFRECPDTEELWLGTQRGDEIQLWRRKGK